MKFDSGKRAKGKFMLLWGTDFDSASATNTNRASVMRMALDTAAVDWSYLFDDFETIAAVTQKDGEDVFHACGYGPNDAVILRMDGNKGTVNWASTVGSGNLEKCRGIINWYDSKSREHRLVALVESNAGSNFGGKDTQAGVVDAFLLTMDMSGDVVRAHQLSLYSSDMTVADGAMVKWGNSIFFAGSATGFQTKL